MKQQDIALIMVVVFISGVFAFALSNYVFLPQKKRTMTVQKVDPIKAEFQSPDKSVFNERAINPTQLIQIGGDSNAQPF